MTHAGNRGRWGTVRPAGEGQKNYEGREGSKTTEHCGNATVELLYGNLKANIKIKP